jgi:tetratricopeptide (TPR) repeat protein
MNILKRCLRRPHFLKKVGQKLLIKKSELTWRRMQLIKSFCGGWRAKRKAQGAKRIIRLVLCAKRKAQGAKRIIRLVLCAKRYAPCAFPLAAGGMIVLLVFFIIGCSSKRDKGFDAVAVAVNNRGAALMGQFSYEAARQVFEELAQKYPRDWEVQTNLAIATFNRQKEGDEQTALSILGRVLEQDPANLRARYCSGLLELYKGRPAKALKYFQTVIKADPEDAEVLYFIGKTLMQLSRYQEAFDFFKHTISRDPYINSAYYGMIMALRQLGRIDDAFAMIEEFQRLQKNPRARLIEFKYTRMGRKAEVLTIDQPNVEPVKNPAGPLFNAVKTIAVNEGTRWHHQQDGTLTRSSVTICDINGDNHPDIFISGAITLPNGIGNVLLLGNPGDGTYTLDSQYPLSEVIGVNAALWGDINNDGFVDVYLCRRGSNRLWYQDTKGNWQDVTRDTGTANGDFDTVDGALFDADHDGDLDIFLVNADGPNELLNNNRDGTFRPLAAKYGLSGNRTASRSMVITDIDADRDADLIIINQRPPHEAYVNELLWKYSPAKGFDTFISADVIAAVAGDVDTDGHTELYTLDSKEVVSRWQPNADGAWEGIIKSFCGGVCAKRKAQGAKRIIRVTPCAKRHAPCAFPLVAEGKGQPGLALTDVDGDGVLDIIVSGRKGWWAASFADTHLKPLFTVPGKEKISLAAWCVLNTVQGPSLLGWAPGKPPFLWTPGPGRYSFASLKLSGRKDSNSQWRSNASGIGTRLSARVGSRWTVLDTFRNHSGPGQGLQPKTVGLGGAKRIDFVSLDWSDGVFQTELDLEAGKIHPVVETQRQISSCPVLFAWNGKIFAFVSDLLGVGGIGYAVGPGEYSEPRPWENFMLPPGLLRPLNGRLKLKLSEPMEEVAYLDAIRLKAYDLPPGWSMTLDERMGINGPVPTGLPHFYRNILIPLKAINDRNENVTAVVAKRDLKAAPPGQLDRRFIGRLQQDHILTVTFPRALDSFPGQAILLADGWVEYPYSQTNFAAWQAGADYRAPAIEVRQPDGQWIVVLEQFGYPAGMPRQMSVPLPPLPKGVRQIRISTNQEIYWDRLAVVFAESCPQVEHHELELELAQLEQIGFPLRTDGAQRVPHYNYGKRQPFWDTHFLEGFYTRFGSVEELVEAKDNAVAIFGVGEEIHLEFRGLAESPRKGWTRVYVLETNGWCKDMDLYTRTSETVEPVPHIGKRVNRIDYLHRLYNTRYLSGRQ